MGFAYITDGHEAANFGIAFGFFVLAYVVGVAAGIRRMDDAAAGRPRRLAHLGLSLSGLLVICGLGMAAVWAGRSDLIFRGDRLAAGAAPVAPSSGPSSGSSTLSSNGSSDDFCSIHTCIGNFDGGSGYVVRCSDGAYSHAGGLSGACSHHGGEAGGVISSRGRNRLARNRAPHSPAVPAYQPPPTPPASQPRLTGATNASSGGFSFTITHLLSEKDLDVPGTRPSFGIGVVASCTEPESSITTWNLASGGSSYDSGAATCFQGTVNPRGMAVPMTVTGCGDHVLTVTPMGFGDKSVPRTLKEGSM